MDLRFSSTVFIVDGDAAAREALAISIRFAGWQPRVASSAEEFLSRTHAVAPCCLLVELELPGLSGLDLQAIVANRPEMPVIVMSRDADVKTIVQAMKAGALEFLAKPLADEPVVSAVRQALERSRAALERLARMRGLRERYESLSPREREVMGLVVAGRLNKQVGGELGISEITVKAHRSKMMRKMQAGSFAELVGMALSPDGQVPERAGSERGWSVREPAVRFPQRTAVRLQSRLGVAPG